MAKSPGLFSPGFLAINLQFALVTAIAALFFAFSAYLAQLGVSPAMAGFIISADALAALIVQPVIAPLVHSGTSRAWLSGGSLILAAALFMEGRVTSVPFLVLARLLQGTGFICVISALIATIVQYIPPGMSGRAFGWISLIRLIPYAVIPPLFDFLKIAPSSFGAVLNVAALTALIPVLMLVLPRPEQAADQGEPRSPGLSGMLASLGSPAVLMLLLSALLFFCGYSAIFFYLKQFGAGMGIANPSFFFTIATIVMILVRLCGGWVFDKYGKVRLCTAGFFVITVCYALLPLCADNHMFFALAGFCGLGWGIAMPLQAAVMFDISPPHARALNQNLLIVMMQGGFFLGPFLSGQIISRSGYPALFVCLALVTFVALLMMPGAGYYAKKQPNRAE